MIALTSLDFFNFWIKVCSQKAIISVLLIVLGLFFFFPISIQRWISVFSSLSLSLQSPASYLSFFLTDKAQHRPLFLIALLPLLPPLRLGFPRCNHGGDEDEVPLSEKGEASPGIVAPLLVCRNFRGYHLQPGLHPQDGAPQEGRGTQVLHKTLKLS